MMDRRTERRTIHALADDPAPATCSTVALAVPAMLMAEALGCVLRGGGLHVVGCYGSLHTLLDKVVRCRPAVVIADADLDDGPGGAACMLAQLRAAGPASKLVVLAGNVDGALARAVIACGACAVILKSSPANDAVGIVQQVLHGRTSFPAAVLARLGEREGPDELSARQLEVLQELALGHSNEVIARNLYISVNTVKFHLRAIYERLGVHNRVAAAGVLASRRIAWAQVPTRPGGPRPSQGGSQPPLRAIA